MFNECPCGITGPKGFYAAGVHCGVKKVKKDLSLVFSEKPAHGAGVFTTNKVPAAPVLVDKHQLDRSPSFRAILVNSGNANACTGERGLNDAWVMVKETALTLGITEHDVLISSTGVIGQYLPMEGICSGIREAVSMLDVDGHTAAAEAIMTTDKFSKELAIQVTLDGVTVTLGGMAKGSGMIAPNMATMLAFVTSDVDISQELLQHSLKQAADRSFNRISVDGDTSTNDMVLILANGLAGNSKLTNKDDPSYQLFYEALEYLLVRLSKMIVVDGEGATKFVEINVTDAATEAEAVQAAKAIANSNLVKTAIHGEDANWGRILAAVGYSGIDFNPEEVEIFFNDVPILRKHYAIDFSEEDAKRVLQRKEIKITVCLNQGTASASFWTCDLSKDYVAINANYRT
ncbi:MAG: bifunctional glutamate N-acetyltransferase/amino-acid acetyltransferase ArgJ [Ignavibacteria bacterium]|nr:bifunctional glutamate N-acetyltransferase/amino-acid acetyltransferase ArgJ [Ignavibacteria bacterium]MBI3765289.1 bifunctional glutamate N-acetyltransferase/amino-acid acetyltransferase ArgJ [Ignavibacteriales bacterium]